MSGYGIVLLEADETLFDFRRAESWALAEAFRGALGFGIDSYWFNPEGKEADPSGSPTYEARSLEEVARIIEGGKA